MPVSPMIILFIFSIVTMHHAPAWASWCALCLANMFPCWCLLWLCPDGEDFKYGHYSLGYRYERDIQHTCTFGLLPFIHRNISACTCDHDCRPSTKSSSRRILPPSFRQRVGPEHQVAVVVRISRNQASAAGLEHSCLRAQNRQLDASLP